MTDLNAKVGSEKCKDIAGSFERNNMIMMNTCFKKHIRRIWTWKSLTGKSKNQIDFITN